MSNCNTPENPQIEAAWDLLAEEKYQAEYDRHVEILLAGRHNFLGPEVELLGELLPGAHVIHLQCSHGLDALGLLNAGAGSVVGVDLSARMIEQARAKTTAIEAGDRAEFIQADATAPPTRLRGTADLVYTGRGALPWIRCLRTWARAVGALLTADGHLFVYEAHPLTFLWDREAAEPRLRDDASYFTVEASEQPGFLAALLDRLVGQARPRMPERPWRPGEVIDALHEHGMQVRLYREYPLLLWGQFPSWLPAAASRLPNSYAILAQRVR